MKFIIINVKRGKVNSFNEKTMTRDFKVCECGHDIRSHWNDCKTLNFPEDCMIDDCNCKEFKEDEKSKQY